MSDESAPIPLDAADPRPRRAAIDFWRGFVLCTIFINHVPGNLFERWTYRNFGLSDSAEAFVFISGLSLALACRHALQPGRRTGVTGGLLRRALRLYGLQIALSLGGVAVFAAGAVLFDDPALMAVHGRDLFASDPLAALVGTVTLGHQLGFFNILPVYVILVAAAPVLLRLARETTAGMLAVSFCLYLLCRASGVNLPTWPVPGRWFFDPFAWQFLMAIGIAVGFRTRPVCGHPVLVAVAAVVLVAGCAIVTDGFSLLPGLWDWARRWADLDKTVLGAGRLVHLLSLAYLVAVFRLGERARALAVFRPLAVIGRHGLFSFGVVSLLAAVDQVVAARLGHTPAVDLALIGGGLALVHGAARAWDGLRLRALAARPARHRDVAGAVPILRPFSGPIERDASATARVAG